MLKGIALDNIIHSGTETLIVHDHRNKEKSLCLKILKTEFPSHAQLKQFENEFEFSHGSCCASVRKALQKTTVDNYPAIVFDYIKSNDLGTFIKAGKHSLVQQLQLAINLTKAIAEIHKENIIHRNINPGNILVESVTEKIFLIDFSLASRISVKSDPSIGNAGILLQYISPEQTGRINRAVDNRADLYALGVVLYELFTGKLPFTSEDPLELIYAHLAKTPALLHELKNELPPVISSIILKLLAKNAEDRYQSATGLQSDLEKCLNQFSGNGTIDPFAIAENDFSGKLSLTQQLYGREEQIKKMFALFEECTSGSSRFLLVSGYSGSGKSALIAELQKPVAEKNGIFITGKFGQFQHDIPYAAFSLAFSEFIEHVLIEEECIRQRWQNKIQHAVGAFGKVLIDLIPGLESLIDIQPEVPELKGVEVQNRFNYVLGNFIRAIATQEHPLVLYIDDLQWADASSLSLLKMIVSNIDSAHLMIIGAYRNNELSEAPLLQGMLNQFSTENINYQEIELNNLSKEHVFTIVKDTLHTSQINAIELAELVFSKTKGNAFFVNQFLRTINEEGLLHFDFEKKEWLWNNAQIAQMNVSGNVVDLMTLLIRKLPNETIEALKIAACIGNRFEPSALAANLKQDEKPVERLLLQPLWEGMIIPTSSGYKFAHDRIQEAIYQLIPEEEKKGIHLHIGKTLSDNTPRKEIQDRIFDIVNQWNIGSDLIPDQEMKYYLSKLNQIAARKARTSAAYSQTLFYFEKSLSLLDADHWEIQYENSLVLHNEAAEAAYLCANYDKVDELTAQVIKHAKDFMDTIKVSEISILKLILQNKLVEAIQLGLSILQKLDVNFPAKPGKPHIIAGLLKTKLALRNKSEDYFTSLPEMTDPGKLAAIRIIYEILSAAYFGMPNLIPLLIFKMVQISVKHGLSRISAFAFMGYGYIECVFMGKVDSGMSYGKIALSMLDRLNIDELKASSLMSYNVFIQHWKKHLSETIPPLEEGFLIGLETGDYEYSSYLAHNITYHSFLAGCSLHELEKKSEQLDKQIEKFRQDLTIKRLRLYRQSIANLVHITEAPDLLKGIIFNENDISLPDVPQNHGYFQNLYLQKLMLALTFNQHKKSYEYAALCRGYLESVQGSALYSIFFFYEALAISLACSENSIKKETLLKALKKNLKQLKKFELLCADNYSHKRQLVEAEYLHHTGDNEKARTIFDRAIAAATKSRMIQDEALCWERAGLFYLSLQEQHIARFYLQHAQSAYQRWGADAKVKQMQELYGDTLGKSGKSEQHSDLDLLTVMKASTAISGEIVLPKLLKKLMQILLENAGAQRGFLIMEKGGELFIEAESNIDTEEIQTHSVPLNNCGMLAEGIVKYVAVSQESVILDNASESLRFGKDEFIRKNQSKSVLCYPFINQGKLRGIIYLSNNLTFGAFTEERLALLRMLTGQIAVSIENASLYENLEYKVYERTQEIVQQKEVIEEKNKDILASIKYARRIQQAILPPDHLVQELLPESFILYKPKDIVSGDFYWLEKKDDHVIVAVVDCTGHGVPGALMSIVGHNGLSRAVNEQGFKKPSDILNYLNKSVNETLRQKYEDSSVRDGMDIALCSFDFKNNKLEFAAAHNPLILIRDNNIIEIKADKHPIGSFIGDSLKPFNNNEIELKAGDVFYIYTDGFADQFGGEKGKKFKSSQLKKLLLSVNKKPLQEQKEIIHDTFKSWKGDLEQVDDVCIIGIRV